MGVKKNPKTARVGGRVHPMYKAMLDESPYNTADAVTYFCKEMMDHERYLIIKKEYLEKEIENDKMDLIAKEMELEEINKELEEEYMHSITATKHESINNVIDQWNIYNIGATRKIPLKVYLGNNEHVLVVEAKRCGMDLEDFKDCVLKQVNV